ncbi:signal peptide peptidase SppA [Asticcacaulis sp. YBE204]|uniref:signal peptide peptidase SppA n=1 Tax=Asticcacaulis sp. YBE204 TaxID=1282363 RepID=UPI0003C3FAE4|nr:signal peptide peptidase SppA [Asticcacaulis sp. YBE204]ESQ80408.1 signal peptide peptidase SppA [Asticcacaulis sp. YBE204]
MKQFLITVGAVLTAFILFFIGVPFLLITMVAASSKPTTPSSVTLLVDLRQGLTDQSKADPFAFITGRPLSTMDIVTSLYHAADDSKVKSVLIRLPEGGIAPAAAEEIRTAVRYVRSKNKTVIAHSQGLYPDTMVVASYMIGSAATEFWMQPHSAFQVTGIATENTFFKRAFDKYGVTPQFEQRYEFKNAVNPYLQSDFTPAHREATLSWMGSIYDSLLSSVVVDRKDLKMDLPKLKAVLEAGPYGAEQAKEMGLITKLGQVHEAEEAAKAKGGADTELMDVESYAATVTSTGAQTIAVINGEGAIMTGKGGGGFGGGEPEMLSDDIAQAFYDAVDNDKVKAIVFRVSSPGGSDTASEQIAQAIKYAQDSGKPVVISMGNYAASGGYWISAGANAIVANPTTLTGSIGVYGGKLAIGDAAARFGVDFRQIGVGGEYAGAYASGKPFTEKQHAAISTWIDGIYNAFVERVAKGRKLPVERVKEIAKGRVWTGAQAKERGLVDDLGGFYAAVDKAKALAKIDKDTKVKLVSYPNNKSPFAMFGKGVEASVKGFEALSFLGWASTDPRAEAIMKEAKQARLREQGASVLAPEPYQPSAR